MEVVTELRLQKASIKTIFKKIWKHALTAFFTYFVTLSLFPGLTSLIHPNELKDWFYISLSVSKTSN